MHLKSGFPSDLTAAKYCPQSTTPPSPSFKQFPQPIALDLLAKHGHYHASSRNATYLMVPTRANSDNIPVDQNITNNLKNYARVKKKNIFHFYSDY